jgi:hypothetical protein
MLRWLRRRQDARRLAQADAEALIATTVPRTYREARQRERAPRDDPRGPDAEHWRRVALNRCETGPATRSDSTPRRGWRRTPSVRDDACSSHYRQKRGAQVSGSIARNRSGRVDRFDQSAAGVGPGPGFFEAASDCAARRLERGVQFVAGVAFGDSLDNRGAFDRALVEMACHDCPANTQSRAGASDDVPRDDPQPNRVFTGSPASAQ